MSVEEPYGSASGGESEIPFGPAKNRPNGEPMLSPAKKHLRDAAIVAAHYAGVPTREIAKERGISTRAVAKIVKAFEARPTMLEQEPTVILERVMRMYEEQLVTFAKVAEDTIDRQPAVAIAALKGRADALERYAGLVRAAGMLPRNLRVFRTEAELNRMLGELVELVKRVESGELAPVEVMEEFRRRRVRALPDVDSAATDVA